MKKLPKWEHPLAVPNQQHPSGTLANYRTAGLADMAIAIPEGRPHRCSLELALHAVDVMTWILKSGETGKFVDMHDDLRTAGSARRRRSQGAAREEAGRHRGEGSKQPAAVGRQLEGMGRSAPPGAGPTFSNGGATMGWQPADNRYDTMTYNRCGRSGLKLPAISLGLWHNFGDDTPHERKRAICRKAFDLGITHFDLANNYGPPPGSAEEAFGEILRTDFAGYRDELIISTKAGYDMWPGPYGEWGSRKYLLASLDQSLKRMGLDYVDIFYSHRFDPDTPLEETMMALDHAVRSGKALYAGISSYNSQRTREAATILRELGTPLLIHQPSYSMINRWVEDDGLLDTLEGLGVGSIVFYAAGARHADRQISRGIPEDSRAAQGKSLRAVFINERTIANIRALNEIAERRGQTLAQMALAWVLRDGRITTALIGASRPEQIEDCVGALKNRDFSDAELAEIDHYARDAGVNLWAASAERAGPARN